MEILYLAHHGILGQKWGVRRYQNEDGSLTSQGKVRYSDVLRNKRLDKSIKKSKIQEAKTLAAREKNRDSLARKYDKKIQKAEAKSSKRPDNDKLVAKIKNLTDTRAARLEDFDIGTKGVKQGYEFYQKVLKDYKNVKMKAIDDKAFRGSYEYKNAVTNYVNQRLSDSYYGNSTMTVLGYTAQYLADKKGT